MLNEINMFLKKEIKNLGWVAEQTLMSDQSQAPLAFSQHSNIQWRNKLLPVFAVTFAGSPELLSLSLFAKLENHQHLHLPEFPESVMGNE
jgi:hypothetical protein